MASVSVVIPAYNPRPEWLAEAITSAVEQEPVPLEVLVVDDGSQVPVTYDHPLVRVIRQSNGGVASARNTGVREAGGELVAFLDQDDVWRPGKLAAQVAAMTPDDALCFTGFDIIRDGTRLPGWGGSVSGYRQLLTGNPIGASTVLVRRSVLSEVGGFDPSLPGADDWDAWLRVARRTGLAHVPDVLASYRVHGGMASRDYRAMWLASVRVLWKHRRALPLAGVRRQGQVYGAQAFDAYRSGRSPADLAWAVALWPGYVAGQVTGRAARAVSGAGRAEPT